MASYSDHVAVDSGFPTRQRNAILWIGAGVAAAAGLIIGTVVIRSGPKAPASAPLPAAVATAGRYQRIPGDYQPVNTQQIAAAFADGRRVYGTEGLSGLANASMRWFERLSREPAYGLMDYCLALDVYGSETYSAVAGDDAPSSTWFGQGPVRRMAAVQALTAGVTDANARMLDTSRAIQAVTAAATPGPPQMATPSAPAPTAGSAPAPRPAMATPAATAPAKPLPSSKLPLPTLAAREGPATRPPPPAQAARAFRDPSFDCRLARSITQQMICAEPELAAADRRLAAAFDRAMAESPNPRAVRRQQDRWLAARESAGADYDAVLDLYDIRLRELRDEP